MKKKNLFNTSEQVEKLRSDLEESSREKFKEIDENRRKAMTVSQSKFLD